MESGRSGYEGREKAGHRELDSMVLPSNFSLVQTPRGGSVALFSAWGAHAKPFGV